MPDEKLEFSLQDLGRLAWTYGTRGPLYYWLSLQATFPEDMERVIKAVNEGYEEAKRLNPIEGTMYELQRRSGCRQQRQVL